MPLLLSENEPGKIGSIVSSGAGRVLCPYGLPDAKDHLFRQPRFPFEPRTSEPVHGVPTLFDVRAPIPPTYDTERQKSLDLWRKFLLSERGMLVCAGHGEGLSLNVSRDLIAPERAVLGSEYFCYDELRSNLKILHDNLPYLGQIITHRFAVQDIREAFEIFFRGETGKVLVEH
jgi:hypothetical protein